MPTQCNNVPRLNGALLNAGLLGIYLPRHSGRTSIAEGARFVVSCPRKSQSAMPSRSNWGGESMARPGGTHSIPPRGLVFPFSVSRISSNLFATGQFRAPGSTNHILRVCAEQGPRSTRRAILAAFWSHPPPSIYPHPPVSVIFRNHCSRKIGYICSTSVPMNWNWFPRCPLRPTRTSSYNRSWRAKNMVRICSSTTRMRSRFLVSVDDFSLVLVLWWVVRRCTW